MDGAVTAQALRRRSFPPETGSWWFFDR